MSASTASNRDSGSNRDLTLPCLLLAAGNGNGTIDVTHGNMSHNPHCLLCASAQRKGGRHIGGLPHYFYADALADP